MLSEGNHYGIKATAKTKMYYYPGGGGELEDAAGVAGYGEDGAAGVYGSSNASGVIGTGAKGVVGIGTSYDFYADGSGTNYGPFTGAHDVIFDDAKNEIKPGLIVSNTGKVAKRKNEDGSYSLSSTLPSVKLATKENDKAVFGVIVKEQKLEANHWYEDKNAKAAIVNALGEGLVWVCEANGDIEAGDYITTSSVPGYGQKQNDDVLHNYTLAKATETIDWKKAKETVTINGKKVKVYLLGVVYVSG